MRAIRGQSLWWIGFFYLALFAFASLSSWFWVGVTDALGVSFRLWRLKLNELHENCCLPRMIELREF